MNFQANPSACWPGLAGRRCLVTGASSGLGAHFSQLLADQDAHIIAAARRHDRVSELCDLIKRNGGSAEPMKMDVSNPDSVGEALQNQEFDLVINNAGTTVSAPALEHDAAAIDEVIDTNLKGSFHVAGSAAESMRNHGRPGVIVNIASILGKRVAGHVAAYAASKAGLIQLTRAMALEWARYDIRVNALCPGYIETDINREFFSTSAGETLIKRIPQRRLGQLSDLDGALLLLLSDLGGFITGTEITVDGGHSVSSL